MYLDHTIGELVEYLETEGWMENSIIVVASDNGGCPSSGGSNYPLRGSKVSYWDGGSKVNLLAARSSFFARALFFLFGGVAFALYGGAAFVFYGGAAFVSYCCDDSFVSAGVCVCVCVCVCVYLCCFSPGACFCVLDEPHPGRTMGHGIRGADARHRLAPDPRHCRRHHP